MSSSASSPSKRALEEFVAGKLAADRLVAAVASRFYGTAGSGEKEALRPVLELAERASPGVVSLERRDGGTGFDVRVVERPFPEESINALRSVAQAALAASWSDPVVPVRADSPRTPIPDPQSRAGQSWLGRVVQAVKRLFTASN